MENIFFATFLLTSTILSGTTTAYATNGTQLTGLGFQLGVHKQFYSFSLGATYTSPQWMQRFNKYKNLLKSSVDLPQTFQMGKLPIDSDVVFTNALFPAITELHVAAGASFVINDRTELHFTYMHVFENTITDNGAGDAFSVFGKGTEIGLSEDTFTLGLSHLF